MNIHLDGITTCDVKVQSLEKQGGMTKEVCLRVDKQIKDYNAENAELKSRVGKIIEQYGLLYGFT